MVILYNVKGETNMKVTAKASKVENVNAQYAANAVVFLYREQTLDERIDRTTRHDNDRGFSVPDAPTGTLIAYKVMAGLPLTESELATAQHFAYKYRRQLAAMGDRKTLRARVKVVSEG